MIFGIGTDIVEVKRMSDNLDKFGDKFARQILTRAEYDEFQIKEHNKANFLAKRFAAKEAAAKALGTGFRDGLILKHIGVGHDELGKPILQFSDQAQSFVEQKKIYQSHLSLADEHEYAVAFVTLESNV